jgi:hypothetical protein
LRRGAVIDLPRFRPGLFSRTAASRQSLRVCRFSKS